MAEDNLKLPGRPDHGYVEHPTYTGPDCAHCALPLHEHLFIFDGKRMIPNENYVEKF